MRVVIQRVSEASVSVGCDTVASIGRGLLVLLGVESADGQEDIDWLCNKIARLRVFSDENGMMNYSLKDVEGEVLLVSQFTLHASTKKGSRPSYIKAAPADIAIPIYKAFARKLIESTSRPVKTGVFGAMMEVRLVNDGPVTILIDSKNKE